MIKTLKSWDILTNFRLQSIIFDKKQDGLRFPVYFTLNSVRKITDVLQVLLPHSKIDE